MASNFYKAGAAAMTSNKDDWETPQSLFDQLDEEFHRFAVRVPPPSGVGRNHGLLSPYYA